MSCVQHFIADLSLLSSKHTITDKQSKASLKPLEIAW